MAKARALDKRRRSVRNIRKITRTMELIATARFKKAMDRATAAAAFTERMTALVGDLVRSGLEIHHPLLEGRYPARKATLLVLTANRGLCGGFNSGVLRLAHARWGQLNAAVPTVNLEISGKRGISSFRFRKIEPHKAFLNFEDRPQFDEVEVLANHYLEAYEAGILDRLDVAYTKFQGMGRQEAVVETLLPLAEVEGLQKTAEAMAPAGETSFEFLPSPESILDEIIPAGFKAKLFKCFLDSAVSEQISRMMAMKAATENADSMISMLTMTFNRARQTQITSELLEVISGADALSE